MVSYAHEAYKNVLLCSGTSRNLPDRRYDHAIGEIHNGKGIPSESGSDTPGDEN